MAQRRSRDKTSCRVRDPQMRRPTKNQSQSRLRAFLSPARESNWSRIVSSLEARRGLRGAEAVNRGVQTHPHAHRARDELRIGGADQLLTLEEEVQSRANRLEL